MPGLASAVARMSEAICGYPCPGYRGAHPGYTPCPTGQVTRRNIGGRALTGSNSDQSPSGST
jgi:hypothetical protein